MAKKTSAPKKGIAALLNSTPDILVPEISLLQIESLLQQPDSIRHVEDISTNFIRSKFDELGDRDVISLASLLGLFPIGGTPEALYSGSEGVKMHEKRAIIDKIIIHFEKHGTAIMLVVLSLLDCIEVEEETIRSDKDRLKGYNISYNWHELIQLITGAPKKKRTSKKDE